MCLKAGKKNTFTRESREGWKGNMTLYRCQTKQIPQTHAILFLEKWLTMDFTKQAVKWLSVPRMKTPQYGLGGGGRSKQEVITDRFVVILRCLSYIINLLRYFKEGSPLLPWLQQQGLMIVGTMTPLTFEQIKRSGFYSHIFKDVFTYKVFPCPVTYTGLVFAFLVAFILAGLLFAQGNEWACFSDVK